MKTWHVRLRNIVWDDGKGEYNVSRLPRALDVIVEGGDADAAIEYALDAATEDEGFLIVGATPMVTEVVEG
jgi:hypothetical protein